jgi:hypothetical protein
MPRNLPGDLLIKNTFFRSTLFALFKIEGASLPIMRGSTASLPLSIVQPSFFLSGSLTFFMFSFGSISTGLVYLVCISKFGSPRPTHRTTPLNSAALVHHVGKP